DVEHLEAPEPDGQLLQRLATDVLRGGHVERLVASDARNNELPLCGDLARRGLTDIGWNEEREFVDAVAVEIDCSTLCEWPQVEGFLETAVFVSCMRLEWLAGKHAFRHAARLAGHRNVIEAKRPRIVRSPRGARGLVRDHGELAVPPRRRKRPDG